jgi:hypothetical protein
MARHGSRAIRHFTISDLFNEFISQAIDLQLVSFLSERHFPWQIICIPSIGNFSQ